jgi:hypothetical protein
MNDITKKIAILVPSCDKYSDLWEPFFTLFWRFLLPSSSTMSADLRRNESPTLPESPKRHARIIVVLKGGLGNQLFSYAAAKRLALVNSAELVINHIAGFRNDPYRREYGLHHFNIPQKLISPTAFVARSGKYTRFLLSRLLSPLPLERRIYIFDKKAGFDPRLYNLKVMGTVYLEGYCQSEKYFSDIEPTIREEYRIVTPHEPVNMAMASRIERTESVCVHARFLHGIPAGKDAHVSGACRSLGVAYFAKAMEIVGSKVPKPHFFIFSDLPDGIRDNIATDYPVTFVTQNEGDLKSYEDLWLMSLCKHFIISNSTFGWWGAWLSDNRGKIVIAPDPERWGVRHFSKSLILDKWIAL